MELLRDQNSTSDIEIRIVEDKDIPALRKLVNLAYQELADLGLNYTATYQDEATTRERVSSGRAFVVFKQNQMIATVLFSKKNYFTDQNTAYVGQLAVHPDFKKQGWGDRLMDLCENLAQKENYRGIQLDTAKPAQHLVTWYLKRGYKIVGETHWEGKTYDSWIFEKIFSEQF